MRDQRPDGSWVIEGGGNEGSPCTYGSALATALACRALRKLAPGAGDEAIARAEQWLAANPGRCVLDDAAVLLGLGRGFDQLRQSARTHLLASQSTDGGWGLDPSSITEPFDTAIAILAPASQPPDVRAAQALQRGREYLIRTQQPDGGWIETTRPPGAVSYAQRMSTAAWSLQALLATRHRPPWR
jgi:hypothetical protein